MNSLVFIRWVSEAAVRRSFSKYVTCNCTKKRIQQSEFLVSIAKFLITAFYRTPPVAASRVFTKSEQNYIAIRLF